MDDGICFGKVETLLSRKMSFTQDVLQNSAEQEKEGENKISLDIFTLSQLSLEFSFELNSLV